LLLFGFVMMFATSPGQTYFIALFSGEIRADLSLSHGEFGAVYSIATLASAFVLLWSGALIDRIDLRRFARYAVIGLAIACLTLALSQNIAMLVIAIFLLRQFGQGLMYMTNTTAMVRYLESNKGKANALSGLGYSFAEATLPSLVILLLFVMGWRQSWLLFAGVLAIGIPIAFHFLLKGHDKRHQQYLSAIAADESQELPFDEAKSKPILLNQNDRTPQTAQAKVARRRQWTRAEVIRDPLFYLFTPGLLAQSLLFTGFMFHQIHLVEEKGWPLVIWGSLYLLYALSAVMMSLIIGVLVDRFGAVRLAPFVTIPMGIGLLILSSSDSVFVAAIFMLCMAISSAAQSITSAPFFAERYGSKNLGAIKSLGTFMMVMMSAISPAVLGWGIDSGIRMDTLAVCGAVYVAITSAMAFHAYRLSLR